MVGTCEKFYRRGIPLNFNREIFLIGKKGGKERRKEGKEKVAGILDMEFG